MQFSMVFIVVLNGSRGCFLPSGWGGLYNLTFDLLKPVYFYFDTLYDVFGIVVVRETHGTIGEG
jgi:hypothetical protein